MDIDEFKVGQTYRNRAFAYEVKAIDGDIMKVQLGDGLTHELSRSQQALILTKIQTEQQAASIMAAQAQAKAAAKPTPTRPATSTTNGTAAKVSPKAPAAPKAPKSTVARIAKPVPPEPVTAPEPPVVETPSGRITFYETQIDYLFNFVGFGNPLAPVWFLGLEEGGADDGLDELNRRLNFGTVEKPYADFQAHIRRVGDTPDPATSQARRLMAYIAITFGEGQEQPDDDTLELWLEESFATRSGTLLKSELMPLPVTSTGAWPYTQIIIDDAANFEAKIRNRDIYNILATASRVALFQKVYAERKEELQPPRYVFCHGPQASWSTFRQIFPLDFETVKLATAPNGPELEIAYARDGDDTWVILLPALTAQRSGTTSYLFDQLREYLELAS